MPFLGPFGNIQVSNGGKDTAHCESVLTVSPLDPNNMVGASRLWPNIAGTNFTTIAYVTVDGGNSWQESGPLPAELEWKSLGNPAVAWDDSGAVYLFAVPTKEFQHDTPAYGIVVYRSPDGGSTWNSNGFFIGTTYHKPSAAGDGNSGSPFYGNVYAVWEDSERKAVKFARTTDRGQSWKGTAADRFEVSLGDNLSTPHVAVGPDGIVYVVCLQNDGSDIALLKSLDGGDTFSAPSTVVKGIWNLTLLPQEDGGYHYLPDGSYKLEVATVPRICVAGQFDLVIAWADYRDFGKTQHTRTYFRHSGDQGMNWDGPDSGQLLLSGGLAAADASELQPQLAAGGGLVGCAFYEFRPLQINVMLALSGDNGFSFSDRVTMTDQPWAPELGAPPFQPGLTFIGDYFGLAASVLGFFPLFTDTRTLAQEIYTDKLTVYQPKDPKSEGKEDLDKPPEKEVFDTPDPFSGQLREGSGTGESSKSRAKGKPFIRPGERPPVGERALKKADEPA
jgi:hypothetical protein